MHPKNQTEDGRPIAMEWEYVRGRTVCAHIRPVVSVNWWKKPGIEGLWRVEQLNYQVASTLPANP